MIETIKEGLLNIWQLPQHLLGVTLLRVYKGDTTKGKVLVDDKVIMNDLAKYPIVRTSDRMKGGISLGDVIIVNEGVSRSTIAHEMGHSKQSRILGPLYLPVIGLPSMIHAWLHKEQSDHTYYDFWTEKWADKLAGIKRNK